MSAVSDAITRGIRVQVECEYRPSDSSPEENLYLFVYTVRIGNHGKMAVQLLSRHWIITNADGKREEVQGPGVIGQQPVIRPGETFRYSSFCPLNTPVGTMHGTYQMATADQETFDAVIAPFSLAVPGALQ